MNTQGVNFQMPPQGQFSSAVDNGYVEVAQRVSLACVRIGHAYALH
jgi:hypothetical protein